MCFNLRKYMSSSSRDKYANKIHSKKKRIYTKIIQLRYKNKVAYKDIVTNQKIYKHRKSNHLCIMYEEFSYNHLMKKK